MSRTKLQQTREEEGLSVPLTIGLESTKDLSGPEKEACDSIRAAVQSRDWYTAKRVFDYCIKNSAVVYNMAMVAALKLGNFEQGIKIYKELGKRNLEKSVKSYCCAIRLHSQLGQQNETLEIWEEAQGSKIWGDTESACSVMCAALHAAAQFGDYVFAQRLLGMMRDKGKVLNALDWNQALDACKNAHEPTAAEEVFSDMIKANVTPNVITFALLVGAHSGEPLDAISEVSNRMVTYNIEPNIPFIEELVSAIIGARRQGVQVINAQLARAVASEAPASHLRAAAQVMDHVESEGVELSQLLRRFKAAIRWVRESSE